MEHQPEAGPCCATAAPGTAPVFVRVMVAEMSGVYRSGFPPGGLAPTSGAGRGEMYVERSMIAGLLSENVI